MNLLENNIAKFKIDFPQSWTFLWSPEEANKISDEYKDQIHFLNEEGTEFVRNYLISSNMITHNYGADYSPFTKGYFNIEKKFIVREDCETEIKKWLFNLGIPFDKYVFINTDHSGKAVMLTWKMVIKYWEGLFFAEDLTIFDGSLNWGLHYSHDDELFFGKEKIFDSNAKIEKILEQNKMLAEIKQRIK